MPIRRPSLVRATIRNRSRSAIAENGEETTALEDGQIKGGKIQHLDGRTGSSTCFTMCRPSHIDRVARSHSAHTKQSPGRSSSKALASSGRPARLFPEAVSSKMSLQPYAFRAWRWRWRSCAVVLIRLYPTSLFERRMASARPIDLSEVMMARALVMSLTELSESTPELGALGHPFKDALVIAGLAVGRLRIGARAYLGCRPDPLAGSGISRSGLD
jgi:hypothetical protein